MERGWMKRFLARKGRVSEAAPWCNHVWIQPLKPLSFMCLLKVNKHQIAFLCITYFSLHNKECLFSSGLSPAVDYCTRKLNPIAHNTWAFSVSLGNTRQPEEKLWFKHVDFPKYPEVWHHKDQIYSLSDLMLHFHGEICIHGDSLCFLITP